MRLVCSLGFFVNHEGKSCAKSEDGTLELYTESDSVVYYKCKKCHDMPFSFLEACHAPDTWLEKVPVRK